MGDYKKYVYRAIPAIQVDVIIKKLIFLHTRQGFNRCWEIISCTPANLLFLENEKNHCHSVLR